MEFDLVKTGPYADGDLWGFGPIANGIYGFLNAISMAFISVMHVASFTDPRIPYLLNLLVILPTNILLILAIISLPGGG